MWSRNRRMLAASVAVAAGLLSAEALARPPAHNAPRHHAIRQAGMRHPLHGTRHAGPIVPDGRRGFAPLGYASPGYVFVPGRGIPGEDCNMPTSTCPNEMRDIQ